MAEILHVINNIRKDTSSNWASINPKLKLAEPAYEIDTGKLKIGNGIDFYEDLPYFTGENKDFTVNGQIGILAGANTYNIVITAENIKYNEVDTIVDKISAVEDDVSLKENRLNKVDKFDKDTANSLQYPSTKAIVDYVKTGIPDAPNDTKYYVLQSSKGIIEWTEVKEGTTTPDDPEIQELKQKIEDQQNEIDTLKSNLQALQDKFDGLINLNEEEF